MKLGPNNGKIDFESEIFSFEVANLLLLDLNGKHYQGYVFGENIKCTLPVTVPYRYYCQETKWESLKVLSTFTRQRLSLLA